MQEGTIYKEAMKTGEEEGSTNVHGLGKEFEQEGTEGTEISRKRTLKERRENH